MNTNKLLISIAGLALISSMAQADTALKDASKAAQALTDSLAYADEAIMAVSSQEAVNLLTASIAEADLTIALAEADFAIRDVTRQEAVNQLAAAVVGAEFAIASVEAQVAINSVSDDQLLNELDATLAGATADDANDMIRAVVSERPMLAAAVQDRALAQGLDEAMVANALTAGFGEAAATAAGE
ncbi:hypothetical protein L1F30_14630 [Simiduia sp. 21SJ11W-1]|uniref:hypothetical protein n=1 Tax=Simiduia sp. 21SJ11W-1 TaxID=2909669 RepID=UPI0020A1FAFB|nr:hypothetical protein [Simiduia sp. 21SJ11W-1]UTA47386.1 hypothetical protein L1F30_14630 [Simiduia sp. 21SJ11W-1]